eukprot:CAMPEP_0171267850 /NCGR_PEP_ID=MMETSP0790-20130122/59367_1 /TAXON_ID=2925 /ORGANISM="Alexandrium catenella, Strain OF101" /LENGTH=42 /DNA_ID= /DNA_START= /DNA_END= /DNA_ORIENTATION=
MSWNMLSGGMYFSQADLSPSACQPTPQVLAPWLQRAAAATYA